MLIALVQGQKKVSYKESDSEGEDDDEVIFRPNRKDRVSGRAAKRRRTEPESEDDFKEAEDVGYSDDGMLSLSLIITADTLLTGGYRHRRFHRCR